jgi:hypothetical protein
MAAWEKLRGRFPRLMLSRCRRPQPSEEQMIGRLNLDVRSSEFSSAWSAIDQATDAAESMAETWNGLVGTELFRSNVHVDENGTGRVDVLVDEYEGHRLDVLQPPHVGSLNYYW